MRRSTLLRALVCAGSLATLTVSAWAQIRVVGSDLVKGPLESLLARPGHTLKVLPTLQGSEPALKALRAKEAQLAFVLETPGSKQDFSGLRRLPIAYQAAIFVVSDKNPLQHLSVAQIRGLFGSDESSKVTRWGDVGAGSEWSNRPVTVRAIAPKASLTYDYFRHTLLITPKLRPALQTEDTIDNLFAALKQDTYSIGLSPVPPQTTSGLKALAVSEGTSETPFPPSLENINVGDYKSRLSIDVVYTAESKDDTKALVLALLSDSFAEDLLKFGLIPLPKDLRRQLATDWSR